MTETTSRTTRFLYRPARRSRHGSTWYLVEVHRGSPVVATVEPVWRVVDEKGATIARRGQRDVVVRGPWESTPSRRHHRAPVEDRGGTVVVETGVDPVTSRFSGARSTN